MYVRSLTMEVQLETQEHKVLGFYNYLPPASIHLLVEMSTFREIVAHIEDVGNYFHQVPIDDYLVGYYTPTKEGTCDNQKFVSFENLDKLLESDYDYISLSYVTMIELFNDTAKELPPPIQEEDSIKSSPKQEDIIDQISQRLAYLEIKSELERHLSDDEELADLVNQYKQELDL